MENIKVNSIDVKPSGLVIVKYVNEQHVMGEATLNTKWQSKEVQFLQSLIGGCAFVTIEQKGQYVNITAVDMNSGVTENERNPNYGKEELAKAKADLKQDLERTGMAPSKDKSITAQCLTKCCAEIAKMQPAGDADLIRKTVLADYNFFLKEL